MNEEFYIGFESYLNNEMPADQKILFDERLKSDLKFRESFNLYKETTSFLENKFDIETIDFKQTLKSISVNHFSDNKKVKTKVINFKPFYYAIAASLVFAAGTWFMMQENASYGDYNQHETAMFVERSVGDLNLKDAEKAFNEKDYKNAVASFEKVTDLTNVEMQYFYAISLIETSDYKKAAVLLNSIKTGTSIYKDKATWYLALSNLKQNKLQACKYYLNQIPVDAEDYKKAQILLNKLD